jgi:hypothetical protein
MSAVEDTSLLEVIGPGRTAGWVEKSSSVSNQSERHELRITSGRFGGAGLCIRTRVAHHPLILWASEEEWCELASVVLPNGGFDSIPIELRSAIATWMMMPLAHIAEASAISELSAVISVERDGCDLRNGTLIELFSHRRRVGFGVLEAPTEWLAALASAMTMLDQPEDLSTQTGVIAAGWTTLRAEQLIAMAAGAALVLDVDAEVEDGEGWLIVDRSAMLVRRSIQDSTWMMSGMPFDISTVLDGDVSVEEDSELGVVRVMAELGSASVLASALRRPHVQAPLEISFRGEGFVALTVNRKRVATGELLRAAGKLVVRIR